MPKIQFVDENDQPIGAGTIPEALERGISHRVVRVFLFNSKGETLIQKRQDTVVSYPGRWDHSAAGHVDVGETYDEAALREMKEEIGVSGIDLEKVYKEYYEASENGRVKKAFHAAYRGLYDGKLILDPHEVAEVQWIDIQELTHWIEERPEDFTPDFIRSFTRLRDTQN